MDSISVEVNVTFVLDLNAINKHQQVPYKEATQNIQVVAISIGAEVDVKVKVYAVILNTSMETDKRTEQVST